MQISRRRDSHASALPPAGPEPGCSLLLLHMLHRPALMSLPCTAKTLRGYSTLHF